jgi:cysteinyl-tRNA synthetase
MFADLLDTMMMVGKGVTKGTFAAIDKLFRKLGGNVLGIVKDEYPEAAGSEDERLVKLIKSLIDKRKAARKRKDFQMADEIRDSFLQSDIIVMDEEGDETTWRMK